MTATLYVNLLVILLGLWIIRCNGSCSHPLFLPFPKDCVDVQLHRGRTSGVYTIYPDGNTPMAVYCEQQLDWGGWTVIQARKDGSVDFYRDWDAYKSGFGDLYKEFWLGNDNIHMLTKGQDQILKVELKYHNEIIYANYFTFYIDNESNNYKLTTGNFNRTVPPEDSFTYHNGMNFTTRDRDNDAHPGFQCAHWALGAWWYNDCLKSNLNGQYGNNGYSKGINWVTWKDHIRSLTGSRMMVKSKYTVRGQK